MNWQLDPLAQQPDQVPPQVPSGNEPLLLSNGQTTLSAPPVVTDANKANPQFVPEPKPQWQLEPLQKPYSERQLGPVESRIMSGTPGSKEVAGRIADIATGANDSLARAISTPAAAVLNVFQGALGRELLTSDDVKKTMTDALRQIPGMGADKSQAFNHWWENLGEKAGTQALLSIALIAGAPAIAAGGTALGGTTGQVLKTVGEASVTHPGMVVAGDLGSVVGGQTLPLAEPFLKAIGIDNPALVNPNTLEVLGSLIGGPIGASMSTLARIHPRATPLPGLFGERKYQGIPRFGGSLVKEAIPGAKPLLNQTFNADDIGKAVEGVQMDIMRKMQDRISHVTRGGTLDPAAEAEKVRAVNREAYDMTGNIEGRMWSEVNQNRPVPEADAQKAAQEVATSTTQDIVRQHDVPGDIIAAIMKWKPGTKMADMRDVARLARSQAAAIAEGTDRSLDTRAANLTKIANAIDDSFVKAYPEDFALAKAKAFTTWKHDQFSGNSPFATVTAAKQNANRLATSAPEAIQQAMRDARYPGQTADVAQTTNLQPEMQGRTEDWLRSQVSEAYRTAQPMPGMDPLKTELYSTQQAEKYMNSPDFKRFAKAFPAMDAVFQRQATQLRNLVAQGQTIARSAFFSKARQAPETAVESLFGSGTKVDDAKLIMQNIGTDQKAVDALQYAMIKRLGNDAHWNPEQMLSRLGSKDLRKVFTQIMGEHEYGRLYRIIDTGAKLAKGESGGLLGMSPARVIGRVFGTQFTGAVGGKSIQVHAIGSKIGGNLMQRIFQVVPPEELIGKAMVDPNWERFLMSKLPENMESFRTTTRLVGLMTAAANQGHKKLTEQDNGR